jgi:hypothetical protein
MRKEKMKISKIRNKKGEITMNIKEIQNLHSNELENLEEMDKFLSTSDPLKLNEENINNLSRSIACNEIEAGIKSLPKKNSQNLMASQVNSTRPSKKN